MNNNVLTQGQAKHFIYGTAVSSILISAMYVLFSFYTTHKSSLLIASIYGVSLSCVFGLLKEFVIKTLNSYNDLKGIKSVYTSSYFNVILFCIGSLVSVVPSLTLYLIIAYT